MQRVVLLACGVLIAIAAVALNYWDVGVLLGNSDAVASSFTSDDFRRDIGSKFVHLSVSKKYRVTLRHSLAARRPSIDMKNVTLVSHLTSDRIPKAKEWCSVWRGPISFSFFLRPGENVSVMDPLKKDACLQTHADLALVELVDLSKKNEDMFTYYPFNVQRNAALDGAVGKWVFLIDIDFVLHPSADGRERIFTQNYHEARKQFSEFSDTPETTLGIVPTVETVNAKVPQPTTHEELLKALRSHEVCAFYGHYCRACHLPTNVNRFAESPRAMYSVQYVDGFEPYIVVDRSSLPRYDERFIGRGYDKMSFFFELSLQSRVFVVLPGPFLVHTGRGDMPKNYTEEYMERQRTNAVLAEQFKHEMKIKYKASDKDILQMEEEDVSVPEGKANWRIISSTSGKPTACISRYRNITGNESLQKRLEGALSYACSQIDCAPLNQGGLRFYPREIVFHADWAFDRYMHFAVSKGQAPEEACNFTGMAKLLPCPAGCQGCVPRDIASDAVIGEAVRWLCSPNVLGNCEGILASIPHVRPNRTLREKAAHLFSMYYNLIKCTSPTPESACSFEGAAVRVPCSAVP